MKHRGSLAVAAVLALASAGCAGRIGHISLAGTSNVCAVDVSSKIKVQAPEKDPRFQGMAWVVTNQCEGNRKVEVYFKEGVTSPLDCKTLVLEKLASGEISAIACLVKADAAKGVYKYGVKLDGAMKVDPDLIIKR